MRILLSSYSFAPAIGGIESLSQLLAEEWVALGHEVTVVTQTAGEGADDTAFAVVRRPKFRQMRALIRRSDVFCQSNSSLNFLLAWPGSRTPLVMAQHTYLYADSRKQAAQSALKRWFIARATNIAVSGAIRDQVAPDSHLIGNAYDSSVFRPLPGIRRDRALVFVGRLVKDKGVDVLLSALCLLRDDGFKPRLTIVGSGEEDANLRAHCAALGLDSQVEFTGSLRGEALVRMLCAHQIMVVPSTWQEPFGIVALEGIACGCVAVGSAGGGLSDAIGPCGRVFPNGDAPALAQVLADLMRSPAALEPFRAQAEAHLERHRESQVAQAYIDVFEKAMGHG